MSTADRLAERAKATVEAARNQGGALRLIGGIAIWVRTPPAIRERFERRYFDIDFVGRRRQSRLLERIMEETGYLPEKRFNAIHGERRLLFHEADQSFQVDVFLDRLEMSHTLDFRSRLEVEPTTVPAAEILLSKLQIAMLNRKDIVDVAMLLAGHRLENVDSESTINLGQVTVLCSENWGLYTTALDNVEKIRRLVPEVVPDEEMAEDVITKLAAIEEATASAPKTAAWRLRARVGRRVRWYEVPDEVEH